MVKFVDDLLKDYDNKVPPKNPVRLVFKGCDGYDVYNPTAPFFYDGMKLMICRVEKRDSEHSKAIFFKEIEENVYEKMMNMPEYDLQDPYISKIGEYYVFGGTEIFEHPENKGNLWWRARFYYGTRLDDLKPLTVGPSGMKDIRLVGISENKIGVFGRPQGNIGGRGKITFGIINHLNELTPEKIDSLELIEKFHDDEWGGVNEARLLSNGHIGVIGHIAKYSNEPDRHYYPMAFSLNPETMEHTEIEIIARRSHLLPGPTKRPDLKDVLFSAGLVVENGKSILYTGVSDCEIQCVEVQNPFK